MWRRGFKRHSRTRRTILAFLITTTLFKWEAANGYSSGGTTGCTLGYISDGYCDPENNIDECDYDGGDCCSCTCVDTSAYSCGANGFDCQDPSAFCYSNSGDDSESYSGTASSEATYGGDDDSNDDYPSCTMGVIALIGDGDCNAINNVLVCGYDGGDCCSCTCEDPTTGGACDTTYDCQNIHADCYEPDTTSGEDSSSSSSSSSNNTLYIALGAGGGVVLAIVAIVLLCFFANKKASSNPSELPGPQQQPPAPGAPPAYPIVEGTIAGAPPAYRVPPPYHA